ncbi:TauD/TfdA family dioxygenase [Sabulicella glaciei]|uniref:TauD/TfdA family dioxygenase n=1 Tax=Sabulicella glaciei TaxID=2984948 RepID=A0ABT3P1Y3_9PROT|nr:TauD/TfdA family dioxygenase [Roseococcus sp. MDT2-1-1]MCW8088415.1 TauD/TfdA family dioxygenase [Roseococcus sp. MDT2-1-1]
MSQALASQPPPMPPGPIFGPAAWTGPEMQKDRSWLYEFTGEELAELDAAIRAHQASGAEMGRISRETFRLPRLSQRLDTALRDLLKGRGFVQFRGFPVEQYTVEQAAIAYLGVGAHLGSFRSQNAKGHLLGHVRDLGLDIRKPTVRYYQTNRELEYHTDSCDIVGLLCLRTSRSGGESMIVSSVMLHNEMLRRRPDLYPLLFNTFPTDRRGEVPPGMLPWFEVPVFSWHEGQLTTIYSGQYIRSAQENFPAARRLSPEEHEALNLFDSLSRDPSLNLKIEFRPGDMQFLHNHQILHSRTDFEDWPEPERRRHLFRLWLAPENGRPLPPSYAQRYGTLTPGDRGGIVTQDTVLKFVLEPQ